MTGEISKLGQELKARVGQEDLRLFKILKNSSRCAEALGRIILHFSSGPISWIVGMFSVAFHLSLESQLNHSVMHGAYEQIPGAEDLSIEKYETLAIPFQSKTWGDAHRIHHATPSILGKDPDTLHPLFRVHETQNWRIWHLGNTFLGIFFVFEFWAFDYDRFLKSIGRRSMADRGEYRKFALFIGYQYLLFPLLAGANWKFVLGGNLCAAVVRNFVFVGLQTGSSVGAGVSTLHPFGVDKSDKNSWVRFQVETSKNFVVSGIWKAICGGLDRHIEHHLFPALPPNRLHEASEKVKESCLNNNIRYQEFSSVWTSLTDSFGYLWRLSKPPRRKINS